MNFDNDPRFPTMNRGPRSTSNPSNNPFPPPIDQSNNPFVQNGLFDHDNQFMQFGEVASSMGRNQPQNLPFQSNMGSIYQQQGTIGFGSISETPTLSPPGSSSRGRTGASARGRGGRAARAKKSSDNNSNENMITFNNNAVSRAMSEAVNDDEMMSESTGDVGLNDDEKKLKRRAAVAAASRATRAKRKREFEELKTKNKRLERERETLLNTIAELQMKVHALRETGSIDLRMENDLLRNELDEHKRFLSHFKHIAKTLPAPKTSKKMVVLQSSDSAVEQVRSLLITSMTDPSWRHGILRLNDEEHNVAKIRVRFQRTPVGSSALDAQRITVRIDSTEVPAGVEDLAESVWARYNDPSAYNTFGKCIEENVSVKWREIDVGLGDSFSPMVGFRSASKDKYNLGVWNGGTMLDSNASSTGDNEDKGRVKAFYRREVLSVPSDLGSISSSVAPIREKEQHTQNRFDLQLQAFNPNIDNKNNNQKIFDMIMVLTGRHISIPRSAFPIVDVRENPVTIEKMLNSSIGNWVMANGNQKDTTPIEGIIIAITSTQHGINGELVPSETAAGTTLASPSQAVIEGVFIRQSSVDKSKSHFTGIYSYPMSPASSANGALTGKDTLIDDNGEFTPAWKDIVAEYIDLVGGRVPAAKFSLTGS